MAPDRIYEWFKIIEADKADSYLQLGQLKQIAFQGREICLSRSEKGYGATSNRCPHAGGKMTEGWLDSEGNSVCPLHRYCFDPQSGKPADGSGFHIISYPIKRQLDGVYIGIGKKS